MRDVHLIRGEDLAIWIEGHPRVYITYRSPTDDEIDHMIGRLISQGAPLEAANTQARRWARSSNMKLVEVSVTDGVLEVAKMMIP